MRARSLLPLIALAACGFGTEPPTWHDQLVPDSPCYRVNLFDGLSEADTSELHALFECLDQGDLTPLAPLVDALDEPDRDGDPAGVDLARLINRLPQAGLDLAAILDALIALLDDERRPVLAAAELCVELLYARPYDQVVLAGPSTEPEALEAGVFVPLLPVLGALATQALDRDDGLAALLAGMLRSTRTQDALATFLAAAGSDQEPLASASAELLFDLGEAFRAAEDVSNDHTDAGGDSSLRVLATGLLADGEAGASVLEELATPAAAMAGDDLVAAGLTEALADASRGGHLAPLPAQLAILATEDARGGTLDPGEDSALVALLRLLHLGHREVSCTTLGVEWLHEDDLSVWLLELMAEQEPDDVDFLLDIGGWTLSWGELVEALAGQCTVDSAQFAADAPALERLVDPEVGDLLVVMLDLLQVLRPEGSTSRVPELVALIDVVHTRGLSAPLEELLKDLAGTRLVALGVDLVPPLVDPWSEGSWCVGGAPSCAEESWAGYAAEDFTGGRRPFDLQAALDLLVVAQEPDGDGLSPLARMRAALALGIARDEAWTALSHGAVLLTTPGAEIADLLGRLPDWQAVDPDWRVLSTSADLLEDGAVTAPALRIAETSAVRDALETTSPEREGPLPFLSRLVTDGTLAEVLATVNLILDLLLEARS